MVEPFLANEIVERSGSPGFRIHCADDEVLDTSEDNRSRAHRARFEGDGERAAAQVPAASNTGRFPQSEDFGVRGWVFVRFPTVAGARNEPSLFVVHGCADGNVAARRR